MKFLYFIFCCLLMSYQAECQVAVNIQITQTSSYCGGAAPPRELIEQLNTPVPLAGKIIYLRKGKTNKLCKKTIELKSDANGEIASLLDPGFYAVVDDTKKDKAHYSELRKRYSKPAEHNGAIDIDCLDEWIKTPHQVIEVTADQTRFQINFHQSCSWNSLPCVQYRGPMPP